MPNKRRFANQEEYEKEFYSIFNKDEFRIVSEYHGMKEKVIILHIPCGTKFEVNATLPINRRILNCPKCSKNFTNCIPYVNDIYTTNPEVYELLADKDDGHKYKAHSNKKTGFLCPFCNHVNIKTISRVTEIGFSCDYCGDNSGSFGEKFVYNMLDQLNVDFNKEYSPEWAYPYRYDFMFIYNDKSYIIEVDGGWHFEDNNKSGKTAEESQKIDKYKDSIAIEHGFTVIRLNYNYKYNNKIDYIVNSIMDSQLSQIFDLSSVVDFDQCAYYAAYTSMQKLIADKWLSGIYCAEQISSDLKICVSTVRAYLKNACKIGLIDISYDEVKKLNKEYSLKYNRRKPRFDDKIIELWNDGFGNFSEIGRIVGTNKNTVREALKRACDNNILPYDYNEMINISTERNYKHRGKRGIKILCNETGEVFNSQSEANMKYGANISLYFSRNQKYSGTLPDGTKLTWQKINQ